MKHLLPCLFLLTQVVAAAPTTPDSNAARPIGTGSPAGRQTDTPVLQSGSQPSLEGRLGFTSPYYLLNRSAWLTLPREGPALRSGSADVGLADPLQIIVIFNAWHLPTASGPDDIRLADLRKHVLHSALVFTSGWPDYTTPGFIVLVQKRNHEWALVARLASHYLVEDESGIGISATSAP